MSQIVCARVRRWSAGASFLASFSYCLKSAPTSRWSSVSRSTASASRIVLRRGVLAPSSRPWAASACARVVVRDFFARRRRVGPLHRRRRRLRAATTPRRRATCELPADADAARADADFFAAEPLVARTSRCAWPRPTSALRGAALLRRRVLADRVFAGRRPCEQRLARRRCALRLRVGHLVGLALVQALAVGRAALGLVVSHRLFSSVGGRIAIDAPVRSTVANHRSAAARAAKRPTPAAHAGARRIARDEKRPTVALDAGARRATAGGALPARRPVVTRPLRRCARRRRWRRLAGRLIGVLGFKAMPRISAAERGKPERAAVVVRGTLGELLAPAAPSRRPSCRRRRCRAASPREVSVRSGRPRVTRPAPTVATSSASPATRPQSHGDGSFDVRMPMPVPISRRPKTRVMRRHVRRAGDARQPSRHRQLGQAEADAEPAEGARGRRASARRAGWAGHGKADARLWCSWVLLDAGASVDAVRGARLMAS